MEYIGYIFGEFTSVMNILLWIAGNVIGIVFGAIPGLSGTMAVMLFMPLTFTMSSGSAIIFLISLWTGGCSGGFVGSVLLGIPGSPSSVATCWRLRTAPCRPTRSNAPSSWTVGTPPRPSRTAAGGTWWMACSPTNLPTGGVRHRCATGWALPSFRWPPRPNRNGTSGCRCWGRWPRC